MTNLNENLNHWDDFSSNIQELMFNGLLCDVILITDGKRSCRLPASRMVLSACSDFFKTMFTSSFKERDCKDVQINDVSSDDLHRLIKVCYSGSLEINADNSESLLRGAHLLQFRTAISICCKYIQESLTPKNCLRFWLVAKHLMMEDLVTKVLEYCGDNLNDIPHSTFVELNAVDFDEFIKNPHLNIWDERKALDIVMNWFKHDPNTRMEHTVKLATWVDFNFVDQSYFSKYLDFLFQFEEAHKFVHPIIKFYFAPMDTEISVASSRKFTKVPISLSAEGWFFYHRVSGKDMWSASKKLCEIINNYDNVIAMHSHNFKLYIARTFPKQYLTIETYDMRNPYHERSIFETRFRTAAITFSHSFMYFIGSNNCICGYNLSTQEYWEISAEPMSLVRSNPGVIVLNEKLYVIFRNDYTVNVSTACFSIRNKTWENCAPLLQPVTDMSIATLNGKIYVLDGGNETYSSSESLFECTNNFQCYDPVQDTWTYRCNFHSECSSVKMCSWNGKILVAGGIFRSTESPNENVYCYDPVEDKWKTMGSAGHESTFLFTAPSNICF